MEQRSVKFILSRVVVTYLSGPQSQGFRRLAIGIAAIGAVGPVMGQCLTIK